MLERMMHMREKVCSCFICLFVCGRTVLGWISKHSHVIRHVESLKTSLGYMHHESDSNQSPEFRFVLLHLKDGEDTRESLVEIHRGHEGLQKGLWRKWWKQQQAHIIAAFTFSSTMNQSMFPKRGCPTWTSTVELLPFPGYFDVRMGQSGAAHMSHLELHLLCIIASWFSSLEVLQTSGLHCGMICFSFSPQTALIEGRWHLTLRSPLGICAKPGLTQLGYSMDVIPISDPMGHGLFYRAPAVVHCQGDQNQIEMLFKLNI